MSEYEFAFINAQLDGLSDNDWDDIWLRILNEWEAWLNDPRPLPSSAPAFGYIFH